MYRELRDPHFFLTDFVGMEVMDLPPEVAVSEDAPAIAIGLPRVACSRTRLFPRDDFATVTAFLRAAVAKGHVVMVRCVATLHPRYSAIDRLATRLEYFEYVP